MENKKFEAAQYSYENAGQLRAIAKILGYEEKLSGNGNIVFSKGNEHHSYSIDDLKKGNRKPDREKIVQQSKERVVAFFNKTEANNNFNEYNQFLQQNYNLAIVKWDNIKGNKNGFTVIDLENKTAYTGEELYKFAYEKNYKLDGNAGRIDINWEELNEIGIDPNKLSKEDKENLRNGQKTGTLQFSIEDTPQNRKFLDKEKVSYTVDNGKLNFEGKAAASKYILLDNTEENKSKLKALDVDFKEHGKQQLKVSGINARKLAIAAITVVYPVAGVALMLVPKRKEIKNDFSFSKDEIKSLENNAVISKKNAKGEQILFQRDKDTNDIVSINAKNIQIPTRIAGVELTPMQIEKLKKGHEIVIINETLNKAAKVRLDLNAKNGLSIKEANNIDIKRETKQIVTDKERLEFVAKQGAKGIDKIFDKKPSEMDSFLEKYNLKKDYASYKEIEKSFSTSKEASSQTTGEKIASQLDKLDAAIKATAHNEASNLYGKSYGKQNESSKMKM